MSERESDDVEAAWIDHVRLRNWYHDLPHNVPPSERRALARQVDESMSRVRAAERRAAATQQREEPTA